MKTICRSCGAPTDTTNFILNKGILCKLTCCIPEMDLWSIPNRQVCKKCHSTLNLIYKFKISCRQVENKINDYLEQHDHFDPTDLLQCDANKNEVLLRNTRSRSARNKNKIDTILCRTCLHRQVTYSSSTSLNEKPLDRLKLIFCIPEMDLRSLPDFKMCQECCVLLDKSYKFKKQCLEIERNCNEYLKGHAHFVTEDFLLWSKKTTVKIKLKNLTVKQEVIDLDDDIIIEEKTVIRHNTRLAAKNVKENKRQDKESDRGNSPIHNVVKKKMDSRKCWHAYTQEVA